MWAKNVTSHGNGPFLFACYFRFYLFCRMVGDHSLSLKRYYVLAR